MHHGGPAINAVVKDVGVGRGATQWRIQGVTRVLSEQ